MPKLSNKYTVLGKAVNKRVFELQKIYLEKGPCSVEFYNQVNSLILYELKKHVHQFSEELVQHVYDRIFNRIVPKLDEDGQYRCFYYHPVSHRKLPGYDPERTNIGSYIMRVINWSFVHYNYHQNKRNSQLLYNEELENYDKYAIYDNDRSYNFKLLNMEKSDLTQDIVSLLAWTATTTK